MSVSQLAKDIRAGDITALARGITLVESQKPSDGDLAKQLLLALKPYRTNSKRLGFSGPPGVGKSSLIEKLGTQLTDKKQKVAVLAVDPSSEITGGSILGDKTRMEELSRSPLSFVRPSATRGHLGGVTSSLPGVILLCEAAGFEWILIESVGVGQSEVELSRMVDLFVLVAQPGGGDELQGIKKGILEYVDIILVNKADRDLALVNATKQQLLASIKILRHSQPPVLGISALTGLNVEQALVEIENCWKQRDPSKRDQFNDNWFNALVISEFKKMLKYDKNCLHSLNSSKQEMQQKDQLPIEAVENFFKTIGLPPKP